MTEISEEKIDIVCQNSDPSITAQVSDALIRSEGESSSVKARQKKVREALQKLKVNIQKDEEPPVIAILASGGGLRAMVGLLGTLGKLAEEDVLDAVTYLCGTSGSTWCMASIYNNEKWSSCMEEIEREMSDRLLNPTWNWKKTLETLKHSFSQVNFSLTNFWGYVFVQNVIKEVNEKTLSDHQAACESGENPYPVYSAVEVDSLNSDKPGAWVEYTPHLVGFPSYKTFVRTEHLGSEFIGGKLVKKHAEKDLCYLQGLWGSAPASNSVIKQTIKDKIQKIFPNIPSEEKLCPCIGCQKFGAFLLSHDLVGMNDAEMEMLFKDFHKNIEGFCEKMRLVLNVLKCFVDWEWGTTNNFLFEWSSNVPDDLHKKKFLSLVDAGLIINSAFPLMLQPNRKVDLFLSFDYSEGDPFLTLKSTVKYCEVNGIPFPKVNIEDTESEIPSQSCYVFEGDGKGIPDVIHFPLFNNQSCEGKVHEFRKTYATKNLSYEESELAELLKISKLNVELNKDRIVEKLQQL